MTSNTTSAAPSVLIVDDTPANLQLLVGMLLERGYRPRVAPSGKLALQAAQTAPPDLILLDINMPEMDGYEVCTRLKADPHLAEIPVIFISAMSETMDKVRAFAVGGVDYVTKPFQLEEVAARLKAHLELRRQKRDLEESYRQLRELETMRDSLTHMIVHDLRGPLTVINGYLQILQVRARTKLSEAESQYLTQAADSSDRLVAMIGSLLDVSRMEAGKMPLHSGPCELGRLVTDVVGRFALAKDRATVTAELPPGLPIVNCDQSLVERVLFNLVDNATKYSPAHGRVLVRVELEPTWVRTLVQDDGPGIPPEFHARIFEKFGTVQMRAAQQKHSTGLGLTFCKLAVEAHGGQVGVNSDGGHGSSFWFTLPR